MSSSQKIIKYFAISLAVFLIVNIVIIFFSLIAAFTTEFTEEKEEKNKKTEIIPLKEQNIQVLDIDLKRTNLVIQTGDTLEVKTNNQYININQNKDTLSIEEKKHSWFSKRNSHLEVIVTLPIDITLEEVDIENGAGTIEIENITSKQLSLDLGAGKTTIKKLNISKKAKIEGGAGEMNLLETTLYNLDLDIGVGKATISGILLGENKIDAGVGEIEINLMDSIENYQVKVDKGIGSTKLNQEELKDNTVYGTGNNYLEIDGGVGAIKITSTEQ